MSMTRILAVVAAAAVLMTGCANQKEPAEKAVAQVEASLAQFKDDAEKYAAEELKGAQESIDKLKAELANKNYKAVVMQTPNVASTVASLMDTVAKGGGKIFVCSPCFKKRKLDENNLVAGAAIVGGAKLVEFMGDACPSISY